MIMGCVGGLLGAGFVALNKRITIERIRLKPGRFVKSLEAALIALLSGCLMILLLYFNPFCRDEKSSDSDSSIDLSEFNKDGRATVFFEKWKVLVFSRIFLFRISKSTRRIDSIRIEIKHFNLHPYVCAFPYPRLSCE